MTGTKRRQKQTEKLRRRAIATGDHKDLKKLITMRIEDYEQANSIMAPIAGLAANVTPAHILRKVNNDS